jgi:RimJ/RimL family protein N-acetyltransferase
MTIQILPASPDQVESFHAALDVVAREERYLGQTKAKPIQVLAEFVAKSLERGEPVYFALDASRVVGWCDISRSGSDSRPHVGGLGMGLLPEYRGKGIGKRLIRAAMDAAKTVGMQRIELTVYVHNAPAIALYKKVGFVEEGLMRSHAKLHGKYVDTLMMAWVDPAIL